MSIPKRLRILFDGTEIQETPGGWTDITDIITRIKENNSIFVTCEAQLTFRDDGYTYLMNLYNSGWFNKTFVEMQEHCGGYYQTFFKGIIFLRSAIIDRRNCTITVRVADNSFFAKIENNRGLEVYPFGESTKLGLPLTPAAVDQVQLFTPATGVNIIIPAPPYSGACYPVYFLLDYLISFMTDNEVEFDSSLFGSGGDYEGLVMTCGKVLSDYGGAGTTEAEFKQFFPKVSFDQLFRELNKKIHIGMFVDYSGTLPKIWIERVEDVRTSNTILQASGILDLTERIAEDEMYSAVRIGSTITSDDPGLSFPADISFVGYKEEQFSTGIDCNHDNELNLLSEYIIDHNVIEDCVINGNTDYDHDPFFIMCDEAGGVYTAQQANLEGVAGVFPVYYNQGLNGNAVMNNYYDAIPISISQYLGNEDNTFSAFHNANYTLDDFGGVFTDELLPVNTDTNDPNALWDGQYYAVPTSGLYSFTVSNFTVSVGSSILEFELYVDRLDPALVFISESLLHDSGALQYINYSVNDASGSIVADAGDFIRLRIRYILATAFNPIPATIQSGYTLECTNTEDGGGVYKEFDPDRYPVINHEWEYPLTLAEYKNIAQNQTGQIEFWRDGEQHYSGWIDQVKFKRFGDEKAKFITYRAKNIPRILNAELELIQVHVVGSLQDIPYTIDPDYYNNPFGGGDTKYRVLFYPAFQDVTVTIPAIHQSADASAPCIIVAEQNAVITNVYNFNTTTATFTIRPGYEYNVRFVYVMTDPGNTFFQVVPQITPPVTAGASGNISIGLINPLVLGDFSFLWSTGATTQSISGLTGNYWCDVTYIPGTFDTNVLRFNVQIPISETGI